MNRRLVPGRYVGSFSARWRNALARLMLAGDIRSGDAVVVGTRDGQLTFDRVAAEASALAGE